MQADHGRRRCRSGDRYLEEVAEVSIISMPVERAELGAPMGGDDAAISTLDVLNPMNQH